MKFVSLNSLTLKKPAKFYCSMQRSNHAAVQFSSDCLKYLRQFKTCINFVISEDSTILRALPAELGLNPKNKLSLQNAALRKLILERFPNDDKFFFDGVINEEEHCIDFDLTKHR